MGSLISGAPNPTTTSMPPGFVDWFNRRIRAHQRTQQSILLRTDMLWYRKTPIISSFDEVKRMGISTLRDPRPTVVTLPPVQICAHLVKYYVISKGERKQPGFNLDPHICKRTSWYTSTELYCLTCTCTY